MHTHTGKASMLVALLLLLVGAGACNSLPVTRSSTDIVFTSATSIRDSNKDLFIISPDDRELIQLTDHSTDDFSPVWSPDRRHVAFISLRNGNADVYVISTDEGELQQVTNTPTDEERPRWSPDGKSLAYITDVSGAQQVFITNLDSGLAFRLAYGGGEHMEHSWSPDGRWIAFGLKGGGDNSQHGIFLRNAQGVNNLQVTDQQDQWPSWSPTGDSLAFQSRRDENESWEIYVVEIGEDGVPGQPKRLTENDADDIEPAWSPNGEWIAFISHRDHNPEIYVIRPGGSGLRRLTINDVVERDIAWSKDNQLIFASNLDGDFELFTMQVDGNGQRRLTFNDVEDVEPNW
jgi:TolB protein